MKQDPQPPPPPHPVIRGAVGDVSLGDIRQILAFMRKHIVKEHGSFVQVYAVYIVDQNSATVHWWDNGFKTITPLDRVKGKWQVSETVIERVIKRGVNIPTG